MASRLHEIWRDALSDIGREPMSSARSQVDYHARVPFTMEVSIIKPNVLSLVIWITWMHHCVGAHNLGPESWHKVIKWFMSPYEQIFVFYHGISIKMVWIRFIIVTWHDDYLASLSAGSAIKGAWKCHRFVTMEKCQQFQQTLAMSPTVASLDVCKKVSTRFFQHFF